MRAVRSLIATEGGLVEEADSIWNFVGPSRSIERAQINATFLSDFRYSNACDETSFGFAAWLVRPASQLRRHTFANPF